MKLNSLLATSRVRRRHLAGVSIVALGLVPSFAALAVPADTTISTAVTGPVSWTHDNFSVTSSGIISGGGTGVDGNPSGGNFSNTGSITGSTTGVYNEGSIGTVTNSGTIQGAGAGFDNDGGTITTFTNNANGVITSSGSSSTGLQNTGTITSLINAGSIYAGPLGIDGIYNPTGGVIGSITNSGTIKGSLYSISSEGTLGTITNTGLIAGNIKNLGGSDLTINGGSTVMGTITGYDEVSVGSINAGTHDVIFASGKTLLNSNITATGHTVRNTGSDLRINKSITITGNYTQTGGSLISGVNTSSDYGKLTVTGNASLTNTSLVLFDIGGHIATGQTYTLVNAGGTLTASNLSTTVNGFSASYSASGQNLIVTLGAATGGAPTNYATLGVQVNQSVGFIGLMIDSISTSTHPDAIIFQTNVLPAINALTDDQKKQMMTDLMASFNFYGGSNGLSTQNFFTAVLSNRITTVQGKLKYTSNETGGLAAGDVGSKGSMWGQIIGGTSSREANQSASGFDATSYGMIVGADLDFTDELTGGLALGWVGSNNNSTINDAGGSVDSYQAALYATWTPKSLGNRFHLDGQLGFGFNDYEQSHLIHAFGLRADADYHGWQYFANLTAGYDLSLGERATLTPYVGLHVAHFTNDGYTETGAGLLNMTIDDYSDNAISHDIGAKVATTFDTSLGKVTPSLKLGWLHDYGGNPASVSGSLAGVTFTSATPSISENGLAIGAGLEIAKSDTLTLALDYDGDLRSDYQSHTASLKATIRF
ncbi:MAG: autotransporter domain-containing protein [Parvibaculaceae bacterium]